MGNSGGSKQIHAVQAAMSQFLDFFSDPSFVQRANDPLACDFAVGNPQEMPLPGFVDALRKQVEPQNKDWFAYKMSEPDAVAVIAQGLKKWRDIDYAPEDIFLTNGAFSALAVVLKAILDPGDEVIFNSPPWFFYEPMILANQCIPVRVRVNPHTFDLDIAAIAAAITPRTRAIIVNSPNNPSGRIYPPETLRQLASLLTDAQRVTGRPIFLISDEAYSRIILNGQKFPSPTEYYPHSFLIYTYGKTLLTPGQRLGYIVLPPEMPNKGDIREAVYTSQFINGFAFPNALLQHAMADLDKLSIDVPHIRQKRDFMVGALQEMGYQVHSPDGTFYLLPHSPIPDDVRFIKELNAEKIFCLPGKVVEMPGFFRISLTASDEMINRSLPGFARALEKSKKV